TRRAQLDAEEARYLREAIAIKLWLRLGYVHFNEYLERELGYAPQVGIERVRVAHALAELPLIEASLAEGELVFSAVRELTRVATVDTEQAWLDAVRGKNLRQIEVLVSGKRPGDRPDGPTRPELVNRVVRFELTPAAFAALRQAQAAMADEHGGRLDDSALIEALCRCALEGGSSSSERPAYQIATTVCESCRRGWQNGAGREIEVGPDVIERAHCDAELIGSGDAEQPARVTSTVTPRMRRHVFARDQHRCAVPGCRSARNLDIHHVQFRSDGGGNESSNLLTLCSGHHAQLHAGSLTIRGGAPHALEFHWREAPGSVHRSACSNSGAARPADDLHRRAVRQSGCVAAGGQCESADPRAVAVAVAAATDADACAALTTAGYKPREAQIAVSEARPHVGANATLEQLIRAALRYCTTPGMSKPHAPAR
ncbi:MAG TPA: hypothetical protein VK607_12540, partial [Kofleriaceae bacterium]|nr:hypothetical protein [Kofleriaceae bacterium]